MLLDGRAPLPGEVMKFPELAATFRSIAKDGKDGFYKGRIAQVRFFGQVYIISESPGKAIVDLVKSKGGVMEMEDLASHESTLVIPIKYTYGGEVTIYEVRIQWFPKEQRCSLG
jgi:gamma-glutamyltranspeptidase/glutathione hydrolase